MKGTITKDTILLDGSKLAHVRGDSAVFNIKITNDDGSDVDLTIENTIIKFALRNTVGAKNLAAPLFLSTYPTNVSTRPPGITGLTVTGDAVLRLEVDSTKLLQPGTYQWDMEVNQPLQPAADLGPGGANSLIATKDSAVLTSTAALSARLRVGQIFKLVSTINDTANGNPVTIQELDFDAKSVTTDYDDWLTDVTRVYELYDVNRNTPSGLKGSFELCRGAVQ